MDLASSNNNPPPETILLESVKKNDVESIRTLIESNRSLLDHEYPSTKTILSTACSEDGVESKTVEILIDLGADIDGNAQWKPLHEASQNPNSRILEVILRKLKPEQINDTDVYGNNALHLLVKSPETKTNEEIFCKNVELLLRAGINVNQGDGKNISAILWAAKHEFRSIITTILENSIAHVDLDNHKLRGKTARNFIEEKNLYEGQLPEPINLSPKDIIFSLAKQSREDELISYLKSNDFDVNWDDTTATLLQYACEKGLIKVAEYLIDKGADIDLTTKNKKKSPVELVTENGFYEIFQMLVDQPDLKIPSKILCDLIKNMDNPKFEKIDHERCCRILLQKIKSNNKGLLDINDEDDLTNTAIHYSLRYADEDTIKTLLKLGASLACKNRCGKMPIEDIEPEMLKNHLDDCIKFNIQDKNKDDFEVTFDYHNLVPPRKIKESDPENNTIQDDILPETEVIAYMSQSTKFKYLLKHPLIVSFLFMKWHKICWLFYINLFFYIFFVVCLAVYIFTYYGRFDAGEPSYIWFIALNVTFWIQILRDLFQITVSPKNYFKKFENSVEIILMIVTGMILYISSPTNGTRKQLASMSILLAAFELVLMVDVHPKLSTYVVMFKTVSINFFKLLLWYSLLIIAFASSFYILFAKSEENQNGNTADADEDLFTGPGKALFKTIIMLTGEFDAGSINFHTYPITSKLIFSLFVFMITIILLNLLNGLAVSDTQTIKNDAELVGHITRAQHIYYVERMLLGNILPTSLMKIMQKFFCYFPCNQDMTYTFFKPLLAKQVCLFTNSQNCQLCVLPNNHGKIFYEFDASSKRRADSWLTCMKTCYATYLDKETIREINTIIKRRQSEIVNIETLRAKIPSLRAKLDQVFNMLSRRRSE